MNPTSHSGDPSATRDRLLAGAEIEFAEHGFDGASLRGITATAGTNLAAVNYHFGSKEGLFREVFCQRMGPINDQRLSLLDEATADASADGPTVESILGAFLGPALALRSSPNGERLLPLMARLFSEPADRVAPLFAVFSEVWGRFLAALCAALPDLPQEEVAWRLHFAIGSMSHVLQKLPKLPKPIGGLIELSDEDATRWLVTYLTAGFHAPRSTRPASETATDQADPEEHHHA